MEVHPLNEAHFKGASSEYYAACYFLSQGHQVYWPSMQHGPVDFIIGDGEPFYRVQVKTARTKNNKHLYADVVSCSQRGHYPRDLYDLLCVVHGKSLWTIGSEALGEHQQIRMDRWEHERRL